MSMNTLELFAGIGGFRQALSLFSKDFGMPVTTVGFSEIEPNAVTTYKSNFNVKNEIEMGDIVAFANDKEKVADLPDFDLLTGGFPCQAFSMMGKQKGFEDIRGNVFFQMGPILETKKPKIVLLENVRNIMSHDGGRTFTTVLSYIRSKGYPYIYHDVFNTVNFGLAQKRNRVFILAFRDNPGDSFVFNSQVVHAAFKAIKKKTSIERQKNTLDVLEKKVDPRFYLSETIKPTILADGSKNYHSKSSINPLIARPLTATMVKLHRACQDNYFSDGFIQAEDPIAYSKIQFSKEELAKQPIRRITPEEAFLLQGFNKKFFANASKGGVSMGQLYREAGNAVSVNTVYAILYYLFVTEKLGDK